MPTVITPELAAAALVKLRAEQERRKRSREMAEECRLSFRKFVPEAWNIVEPSKPFIPNCYHIEAISDHMQAVSDGQIQNLIIVVPPGSAKSTLVSVLFPAWKWIASPGWRGTFASYEAGLSTRDSVRCRELIQSVWYRETFQPKWKLSTDQNEKTYFVNTDKGFRVSTSVGGRGTGWRSDTIVCLDYKVKLTTDQGKIEIGRIVDERLPVRIRAFNHATGLPRWQPIEAYESSPGRPMVRVKLSNGEALDVTTDHPFFAKSRGYIQASSLKAGDQLLHESELQDMRSGDTGEAERYREIPNGAILREHVCGHRADAASAGSMQGGLSGVWQAGLSLATSSGQSEAGVLQLRMSPRMAARPEQPNVHRWRTGQGVPSVRYVFQDKAMGNKKSWRGQRVVLQQEMQRDRPLRESERKLYRSTAHVMRNMRDDVPPEGFQNRETNLLFQGLCERSPEQTHAGTREPFLRSRSRCSRVPEGVHKDRSKDQEARRILLPRLRKDESTDAVGSRRTPHRLFEDKQRPTESDLTMPRVSWAGARITRTQGDGQATTVLSVEPTANAKRVFNVRVAEDHNYFASGVLLHNCDDALSTDARFSEPTLTFCIQWYENVFWNRLTNLNTGSRVIIGQRVCDNDLIGHLLRRGGFELLLIPMEFDPARSKVTSIGWQDPRQKAGDLMFPPLFPRPVIDELKKNQDVWYTQYQGQPNVEGGGIIKSHWWNYWQPKGANLPPVRVKMPNGDIQQRTAVEYPDSFDLEAQAWDFAFKDLKTSDFVAGLQAGVRGASRYIGLHMEHAKMDLPASLTAVRIMTGHYPKAHLKLVEDKANGPAVIQSLRHEIAGLVEVNPEGGKIARASAATPELQAGNWYLPHPMIAPWVGNPENPTESGFLAETVAFPFGANDDYCDAWSMLANRIQSEKIGGVFGVSESDLRVDPFDFDPKWPRLYGLAVTWKEVAAVWMCRKPETGEFCMYAEYCVPPTSPAQHAAEILKPGDWIQGVITPSDTGRDEKDGYAMIGKYRALRLKLDSLPQNEEAHILEFQDALRMGKLKIFGNLATLLNQLRSYRRADNGKLPSDNCGAVKAALVAWAGRSRIKGPAEPPKPDRASVYRTGPPSNSWMSS